MTQEQNNVGWEQLVSVIAQLRGENGCHWDKEQDHQSLKKNLIEETYEVIDAIDSQEPENLCEELGDILLQVLMHAQIASEEGAFNIDDVIKGLENKMVRRHPHVFGDAVAQDSQQVLTQWENIKLTEKHKGENGEGTLMRINRNLPSLLFAQKVQEKAARVGFDWKEESGVWGKLQEELAELHEAKNIKEKKEELGDCLFTLINISRHLQIDAEDALRFSTEKFIKRFSYLEQRLQGQGRSLTDATLEEMNAYWEEAKKTI